jgi:hypothetical protein
MLEIRLFGIFRIAPRIFTLGGWEARGVPCVLCSLPGKFGLMGGLDAKFLGPSDAAR